jgi:hypothetical protein
MTSWIRVTSPENIGYTLTPSFKPPPLFSWLAVAIKRQHHAGNRIPHLVKLGTGKVFIPLVGPANSQTFINN